MEADPAQTQAIYDRQAAAYDAKRSRALFEARWLARFTACLPAGGRLLDLGCGTGAPIAQWFSAEGFDVTGLDFSPVMLRIAAERLPSVTWHLGDLRDFELDTAFDGIIAWNSFFHLTGAEQRACIARMARHLRPRGALLLTVGPKAGEATGTVGTETVYHASLSPAAYAAELEANGLRLTGFLAEDPETQRHSVLMAQKI